MHGTKPGITGAAHAAMTTDKLEHNASTYNSIGKEVIRLVGPSLVLRIVALDVDRDTKMRLATSRQF